MRMYPAYKLSDVIEEYAITFYSLLNEGYRLRYSFLLLQANIVDLPHMKTEDRKNFYRELKWASMHPNDILKPMSEGSSKSEIKKLLGGK